MRAVPQPKRRRQIRMCNRDGALQQACTSLFVINIGVPLKLFTFAPHIEDTMDAQRRIAESVDAVYNGSLLASGVRYAQFICDTHLQVLTIERLILQLIPGSCTQSFRAAIME